ncbi:O-antigen ligase family protein [Candidatus Woesebacteria bacterium]|nr:O-antigen ligase family protein [Candidatus Woesebacteria bacterium]
MLAILDNLISWLYYALFFLVPLVLFPSTSEVFEFNKMILVYTLTALILTPWVVKMIIQKRFVFRRTLLDVPLFIFLLSQLISTFFSIDVHTSLFGFYSRFNGGLLSSLSYALLYWAFVSNMNKNKSIKSIYSLLASSFLVSLYGFLEHFGIDKNLWVQDVQNRVFSTLGQPNWLAAWIIALAPLLWGFGLLIKNDGWGLKKRDIVWMALAMLQFATLLFTKSRSGILGFITAYVIFWVILFFKRLIKSKTLKFPIILSLLFLVLTIMIGTPWISGLSSLFKQRAGSQETKAKQQGPLLETGGTESGVIRKIVWRGAIDIWKNNFLVGTGPETFAYIYYQYRPKEHNMVSEWDFIYNKAHNEFLNMASNTGTFGLVSYLVLIMFSILQLYNFKFAANKKNSDLEIGNSFCQFDVRIIKISLLTGYLGLLVTNFFGFSVVVTQLQFFLFPAVAVGFENKPENKDETKKENQINTTQKILTLITLLSLLYVLFAIYNYWRADILYTKGKLQSRTSDYINSRKNLQEAVKLNPNEALYWNELGEPWCDRSSLFD